MPTENRSSNTEMVSVPREPTAEMLAAAKKSGVIDPRVSGYCYALMVAAAPTHQGEPVAYLCKAEGAKWLQYGSKVGAPWKPGEVQVTPLYTHADPGEVERLRYKAELYDEVWELAIGLGFMNVTTAISKLRTQLAERDALLREVAESAAWGIADLRMRIEKVLSVNAEPSAPKVECCKLCGGEGSTRTGIDEAPTTVCSRCDGTGNEPSAPVERDERAAFAERCDGKEQEAFEAWAKGQNYDMACHPLHWLFLDAKTCAARQGWAAGLEYATGVARAALERKPS